MVGLEVIIVLVTRSETSGDRLQEGLLTPQKVAEILKIKRARVYEAVRDGRLPAVRITGKLIRFRPQDVERFIAKCLKPE